MKNLSLCDVYNVYLHTDIQNCLQRISKRGRGGESNIRDTYLQNLEDKYFELYNNLNKFEVDGNVSIKEIDRTVEHILSKIF
jgi:deoxyadenosine/deoxycytidine kinase